MRGEIYKYKVGKHQMYTEFEYKCKVGKHQKNTEFELYRQGG